MNIRIGHGYDVHTFQDGDGIVLGGVRIPFDKSFAAHSDGDVLIHALCDALLGAAALGDIGKHFPDTDSFYKGIDSRELLRHVVGLLADKGFRVGNMDATIIAQAPKMAAHILSMQNNLSTDMNIEHDQVNVKATTTEKLGFAGRGEGIAVHAVVLIEKSS